jgi:chromosome segregation ATPase
MIGLGGSGGGDAGTDSLAALLTVIADPDAAKTRLKELTAKSKEASTFLEQAKAENLKTEALRAEIEPKQAAIESALRLQASKEADLTAREEKHRNNVAALDARAKALAEGELAAVVRDKQLGTRENALKQAEFDNVAKIQASLVDLDKTIAARKQQIEDDCAGQIGDANRLQARATEALKKAEATLADAVKKQAAYEARLAKLQELAKGDA